MPTSDSSYMNRYRKRNNATELFTSERWVSNKSQGVDKWGSLKLLEETWDRENSWWQWQRLIRQTKPEEYRRRRMMYDKGSPFFNRKVYADMGEEFVDLAHANTSYSRFYGYKGPIVARISTDAALNSGPLNSVLAPSSELELDAKGATAISRCAPASPHASAYTSIGELYRDGLPAIPGLRTLRNGGSGSDEYLNFQFGVLPIISDIRSLTSAASNAQRILRQYERDAGRLVRRRYSFPTEEKLVSRVVTPNQLPFGGAGLTNNYLWQSNGETIYTVKETTETWFSGAFTYALLNHDDVVERLGDQIRKANHLFGVLPTSEALWNLSPWSWAADWVTNIGDVMNNISMYQSDGLLMRWGYVMEKKIQLHEYHHRGSVAKLYGGGTKSVNLTQRFWVETQRRRPATPFGFGFELDGLSGRQEAILAALAFSRM